jgi:imidazolonepropionase-like amidohydrolase
MQISFDKDDKDDKLSRIDAQTLIPGRGPPLDHASLIFSAKIIVFVGKTSQLDPKYKTLAAIQVPVLMPGLWDSHLHFNGATMYGADVMASTHQAVAGARLARDVVALLNAGFTSVRELAGYGVQMAQVIEEGWLPGPNIYSAVSVLSMTAGHGDPRNIPLHVFQDQIAHNLPSCLCDGPNECTKAVRVQIRNGAQVIKVAASGGVTTKGNDIQARQFSDEELSAIVAEAERNNMLVAAHCHGNAGILAALRAGCKTIEHATFLEDDGLSLMVEKDSMLIATRTALEMSIQHPEAWTPAQYEQLKAIKKRHKESYSKAVRAGVRIALGTDIATSAVDKPWNRHGINGMEFKYAVEAGMTPLQAIEAGTANAPDTLGPQAPKSGWLKEGYDADFIALYHNPLDDIEILGDARNITHVWKGGKLVKKDGQPINILG